MYTLSVFVVTLGVAIAFNPIEPIEDIIKDTLFPDNPCFSLIPYIKKYVEDTSDCALGHVAVAINLALKENLLIQNVKIVLGRIQIRSLTVTVKPVKVNS